MIDDDDDFMGEDRDVCFRCGEDSDGKFLCPYCREEVDNSYEEMWDRHNGIPPIRKGEP